MKEPGLWLHAIGCAEPSGLSRNNRGRHPQHFNHTFFSWDVGGRRINFLLALKSENRRFYHMNSQLCLSRQPSNPLSSQLLSPGPPEWIRELAWTHHFTAWTTLVDFYPPFFKFLLFSYLKALICPCPFACARCSILGLPPKETSQMLKVGAATWHSGWGLWDFRVFSRSCYHWWIAFQPIVTIFLLDPLQNKWPEDFVSLLCNGKAFLWGLLPASDPGATLCRWCYHVSLSVRWG